MVKTAKKLECSTTFQIDLKWEQRAELVSTLKLEPIKVPNFQWGAGIKLARSHDKDLNF